MAGRKSPNIELYPYVITWLGQKTILVWQTVEAGKDGFKFISRNRLMTAKSRDELEDILGEQVSNVVWDEIAEIDLDAFQTSVSRLRPQTIFAPEIWNLFLDGWNFFEDIAKTFGNTKLSERLRTPEMDEIYRKIFHCDRPLSAEAKNKTIQPILSKAEIERFKTEMMDILNHLKIEKVILR